jgi:CPA1 family monovalent cation:H+ antiporter
MAILDLLALLISLTAVFAWVNHRYFKLPTTIGVMVMGMAFSLLLIGLDKLDVPLAIRIERALEGIDFSTVLMHGMLSFLLFAGALHVKLSDLAKARWLIGSMATVGVVISTLVIGVLTKFGFALLGLELSWLIAFLFGALISPTDPIAVLAILRRIGVEKRLEIKVTGESLFNDGVGVVVFLLLLGVLTGREELSVGNAAFLFATEAIGGAVFGLALGWLANYMLSRVDNYQVEVLLTLAVVMGGYAGATALHLSGPIAIVLAGLMIGNQGRHGAMSESTREHVDTFWELIDEILNAVLFVLIGVELLLISTESSYLLAGLMAIPIVLLGRVLSVLPPVKLLGLRQEFPPMTLRLMIWGGLRGGISVALALSLPVGPDRDLLLTVTYCVVVFSILVQGLTIGKVVGSKPSGR